VGVKTLLSFLRELDNVGVHYSLAHYTASDVPLNVAAITVHVTASATERWEVEFFEDGTVEVERFTGGGPQTADVDRLLRKLAAASE
jgi:hypothetical protein